MPVTWLCCPTSPTNCSTGNQRYEKRKQLRLLPLFLCLVCPAGRESLVSQCPRCRPAPLAGTLRWARFLPDEKSGKESPKAGPSPALWNPPRRTGGGRAPFSVRPLVRWGHIDGLPVYGMHLLLCWCILLPSGPYSGEPLFPAIGGRLPAAGTPHTGVRPWKQRHGFTEKGMLSIDVPGHLCDPTKARAGHRIDAVPASYPKGGP